MSPSILIDYKTIGGGMVEMKKKGLWRRRHTAQWHCRVFFGFAHSQTTDAT